MIKGKASALVTATESICLVFLVGSGVEVASKLGKVLEATYPHASCSFMIRSNREEAVFA